MIRVKSNRIIIYFPAGEAGKEVIRRLQKYGVYGELTEVYCG